MKEKKGALTAQAERKEEKKKRKIPAVGSSVIPVSLWRPVLSHPGYLLRRVLFTRILSDLSDCKVCKLVMSISRVP